MRKYKLVEFQFNPEIEKIVKRLRRENKNSKAAAAMDGLEDVEILNHLGGIQPVNGR